MSAWHRLRKQVTVDLFPERPDRVEAMANLTFLFDANIINKGRPIPLNAQGSGVGTDVTLFGSRFVSA